MNDVDARVVTDTHTHIHTDTQDKYRSPPAHACRGLTSCEFDIPLSVFHRGFIGEKTSSDPSIVFSEKRLPQAR